MGGETAGLGAEKNENEKSLKARPLIAPAPNPLRRAWERGSRDMERGELLMGEGRGRMRPSLDAAPSSVRTSGPQRNRRTFFEIIG